MASGRWVLWGNRVRLHYTILRGLPIQEGRILVSSSTCY